MDTKIYYDNSARLRILDGINELTRAVTTSLGPKGRTAIIDDGSNHPKVTKDGASIARAVEQSSDRIKNIGINLAKEVSQKVEAVAGDGTTTSTLLFGNLAKRANEIVNLGFDVYDVKRGFEAAKEEVIKEIDNIKKTVTSSDDIYHIAEISANNDEEIAGYIKQAYESIGDDGKVIAIASHNRSGKTFITVSSGLEINRGFNTSKVINTENETCEFENPLYFCYGTKLDSWEDIEPIFTFSKDRPVVIVAPAYEDEFMVSYLEKLDKKEIKAVCIGPEGTSRAALEDNLEDIAVLVGATVINGRKNISIDKFGPKMFGSSESIIVEKRKTTISGGAGTEEDIEKHVNFIKEHIIKANEESFGEDTKSIYEINFAKERIAKLSGGIATIHYGGYSSAEINEKHDRYDDALKAVSSAIEDGILAGGGCGLFKAAERVKRRIPTDKSESFIIGFKAILDICQLPLKAIIKSTGLEPGYYVEQIRQKADDSMYGYNAKTEKFVDDLYKEGIIDPAKVEKACLTYSTSIAGAFMTLNCAIVPNNGQLKLEANDKVMEQERYLE